MTHENQHYIVPDEVSDKIRKYDEIVKILSERSPYNGNRETCDMIREIIGKSDETTSHSEADIYKSCVELMHELVSDFAEWYKWVHGEDAIQELDDEEMFCVRKTPFHIVQNLFLSNTRHSGGTSTCRKCNQLGIKDWSEDIEFAFEREDEEE